MSHPLKYSLALKVTSLDCWLIAFMFMQALEKPIPTWAWVLFWVELVMNLLGILASWSTDR